MNTFETKLAALSEEARGWLLGTKSANPLGCAFTKKRVVHPGAGGKLGGSNGADARSGG